MDQSAIPRFTSLAIDLERGRRAYRAAELARAIPWPPGALCPVCHGFGQQEVWNALNGIVRLQRCGCGA